MSGPLFPMWTLRSYVCDVFSNAIDDRLYGTRWRSDYKARRSIQKPGFESSCYRFENLAISLTPRCHSGLICINEYMAAHRGGYFNE